VKLFKLSKLLKVWVHLMGLWFKAKPEEAPKLLGFDANRLKTELTVGWSQLYDMRNESSWKFLLGQVQRFRNIQTLNLAGVKLDADTAVAFARLKGRIEALAEIETTLQTEFRRLEVASKTDGAKDTNAESIIKNRKANKKPSISY